MSIRLGIVQIWALFVPEKSFKLMDVLAFSNLAQQINFVFGPQQMNSAMANTEGARLLHPVILLS